MKISRWFWLPLIAFGLSRLLVFGVGILTSTMLTVSGNHWVASPDHPFLSLWAKWDSQYYVDIAVNSYWFRPGQQSNVAFFPVYPLFMRMAGAALGGDVVLAGFLISNLACLGALIFLYLLARLELDEASAGRAVFYLAFFPSAFFLSSVYTESLFLFFAIGGMFFIRKHQWFAAALMGLFASATRNLGVLLWALAMWEWLRVQGWSIKTCLNKQSWVDLRNGAREHWFELFIIAVMPLGLLAYMYFLKINFDRPLAFIETQAAWSQGSSVTGQLVKNLATLATGAINKGWLAIFWNLVVRALFILATPFIWFRLGEGYAIYVLILMIAPAASGTGSMLRYALGAFPVFILLADWGRREIIDRSLVASFSLLLGVFVSMFVNWVFVG